MTTIAGRLYGPPLPTAGVPVTVDFQGETLVVHGAQARQVPASAITVSAGGFEHDALSLAWREGDDRWGLIVADKASRQALVGRAPPTLATQMGRYLRKVDALSLKLRVLVALAAMLVVGVGLLWWQYDTAVAWAARQVPPDTEARIGEAGLEQVRANQTLLSDGPMVDLVRDIGNRLSRGSRYDYEWFVADTDAINALALPGGKVIVFRGLIETADRAELLAGVLAHEIEHVEQQHSLRNLIHSAGWAAVLTVTLGDASGLATVLIHQMGNMRFGRKLEAQADLGGIQALHEAGIDPRGLTAFFEQIQGDTAALPDAVEFVSSHPLTRNRIEQVNAAIDALPERRYNALPHDLAAVLAASEVDQVD